MTRVLSAGSDVEVEPAPGRSPNELWLSAAALAEATGWHLRPEGLCQGDVCAPIPADARAKLVDGDTVNASGLWERLGRPVLCDAAASTWMLGEAARDRGRKLASLEAPDFTLPDIEGKLHSLSDFRGKKVFLATWASW
jgi:hypothetical protein